MDNEGGEAVGRRIALGLAAYLKKFAARQDAEPWWVFAAGDLLNWKYHLLEAVDDPATTVLFNLRGVDARRGADRAATPGHSPTDWELLLIREHEIWWPRVEWWDEDARTPNPFESERDP